MAPGGSCPGTIRNCSTSTTRGSCFSDIRVKISARRCRQNEVLGKSPRHHRRQRARVARSMSNSRVSRSRECPYSR